MFKAIGIALAILFAVGLMATIAKEKGFGRVLALVVAVLVIAAIVRIFSPLVALVVVVLFFVFANR